MPYAVKVIFIIDISKYLWKQHASIYIYHFNKKLELSKNDTIQRSES